MYSKKQSRKSKSSRWVGIILLILLGLSLGGCGLSQAENNVEFVAEWGTNGTTDGQFLFIEDFAFDQAGNLLVTDALRKDVQVFSRDGELLRVFGSGESGKAALEKPGFSTFFPWTHIMKVK